MWWTLGTKTTQGTGNTPNPQVTIHGPSGTFALVLTGRIPAADALATTSLSVVGDQSLAQTFLQSWKLL
jgi:hypothetical protein